MRKDGIKSAMALIIAGALAFSGCTFGGGNSGPLNGGSKTVADADVSDISGRYTIFQMTTADTPVGPETLQAMGLGDSYIVINDDGSGELKLGDVSSAISLDGKGKLAVDGTPMYDYEYYEDVLTISLAALTYTFVREGADAVAALDDANVDEVTDVLADARAEFEQQMEEAMAKYKSTMQVWEESERQLEADIESYQKGRETQEAGIDYYYDSTYPADKDAEKALAKDEMDDFSVYYYDNPFYLELASVTPSGSLRDDMLKIARSQLGYYEGNRYSDLCGLNASGDDDFTEYGKYHGSIGTAWCSEFASWCVRMTGIPFNRISTSRCACATNFTEGTSASYYAWEDTVYAGGDFEPQGGEIIFWVFDDDPYGPDDALSHTSILEEAIDMGDSIIFHVIEGNTSNTVMENDYVLNSDGTLVDGGKLGYIISPDYISANAEVTAYFDANGGNLSWDSKSVFPGGLYGVMPYPENLDTTFAGWYTAPEGGEKITPYSQVTATGDITLYAHYK